MDKLATLQHQLQEAEEKKVALQDQVRIYQRSQVLPRELKIFKPSKLHKSPLFYCHALS